MAQAQAAGEAGEAPIGAAIYDPATGEVVAAAGNAPIATHDPTGHAEIRALREAAANLFASGEIMSGNILGKGYLAGFGMTIGTVFGRIAGAEAARHARN